VARYSTIAGCPVPTDLADPVRQVIARTRQEPTSVARCNDRECLAILHAHGKHSQQEIWDAYVQGRGAEFGIVGTPNRPGRSTHELRSDGVACRGPVGRRLAGWQCGMDWPDASIPQVMAAFRAIGCVPIHPYASGAEHHHLNLAKAPKLPLELKRGDRGPRVWLLTHRMAVAGLLPHSGLFFSLHVEEQVRAFQHRIHLAPDGVVGPVTWRNVEVAARRARKAAKR